MSPNYSFEVYKGLEEEFYRMALFRPMRLRRYEAGTELTCDVTGVVEAKGGRVHLTIERFVGGGFAGQVYRVKIRDIEPEAQAIQGLEVGGVYAMKVLIPPTGFSRLFRNVLYWVGFQGAFQPQVNPAAARAGAIWQRFIRRGAKVRFGDEGVVVNIYATFVDSKLGGMGELSEWVEGRTWRLEADEHLDVLKQWSKGKEVEAENLGSPEYRAKREFMNNFVSLLHEMGAHEFARQYEWSTWKSQPNCLKRKDTDDSPSEGLVSVDFRAGLVLLPFLPMSPGDFKLILNGIGRGSLVQFDRGDIHRLEGFIGTHSDAFADMGPMLEELKAVEQVYRDSTPDITHNHVRLLYSSRLWSTILDGAATGWRVRNLIDEQHQERLKETRALTLLFFIIGIIPIIGGVPRRIWGDPNWRRHYWNMLSNLGYLKRALRAKAIEKIIEWHSSGRVDSKGALKAASHLRWFSYHLPFSVLPAKLHRFVTDREYAREKLVYLFIRPVRLYFNAPMREQWLLDMVTEGKKNHLLSDEDEGVITSQIKEPFIQKYLKSLAVHVCTLPVTQIVSVIVALIYVAMHPELTWEAAGAGAGIILIAFQVTPISPGSLVRGLYVLYLVIKERNFKDYNIAVFLGFFKYVGYLAFPIQMTHRYPALARFMAGHWATGAAHVVPVFGERGALLEHKVFSLFYNRPLTIRSRMRRRAEIRSKMRPRYWHIAACAIIGSGVFGLTDFIYLGTLGALPSLKDIWWLTVLAPMLCGGLVTLGAGGAPLRNRFLGAAVCGCLIGMLYMTTSSILGHGGTMGVGEIVRGFTWRAFIFTILSTTGAILTELKVPEPRA